MKKSLLTLSLLLTLTLSTLSAPAPFNRTKSQPHERLQPNSLVGCWEVRWGSSPYFFSLTESGDYFCRSSIDGPTRYVGRWHVEEVTPTAVTFVVNESVVGGTNVWSFTTRVERQDNVLSGETISGSYGKVGPVTMRRTFFQSDKL